MRLGKRSPRAFYFLFAANARKMKNPERCITRNNVLVVVNFLSQLIFIFPLFFGMVMYANEFETKENKKLPEIKY